MSARLSAFVIWALIAATAVFWSLRLFVRAAPAPSNAVAVGGAVVGGDLTRLFGTPLASTPVAAAAPDAGARFKLLGIMAPKRAVADAKGRGVALIAVDGKAPRAYAVGSRLDGDLVLQSVNLRTASIGTPEGAKTVVLEIPRLPPAATGTLPAFGSNAPVPSGSGSTLQPPVAGAGQPPLGAPGTAGPPIQIPGPVSVGGVQTQ